MRKKKGEMETGIEVGVGAQGEAGQSIGEYGISTATRTTGGVFGASVVEVLKLEFFIAAPEERFEHYQHPIPRLKKDKVKRGYAHHGKAENLGVWTTVVARTKDEWAFVHVSFPLDNSVV